VSAITRSVKGSAIGSLSFIAQVLQGLFLVPIMLQGWGGDQYAIWITCQAGMTMLLVFETGHQTYVGNEIAKAWSIDPEQVRNLLGSALRLELILGLLELAVTAGIWLLNLAPLAFGLNVEQAHEKSVGLLVFILVSSWLPVGAFGGLYAKVYVAAGQFSRAALLGLATRLLITAATAAAAWVDAALLGTAWTVGSVTLALGALCLIDAYRMFPALRPSRAHGTLQEGVRNFTRSLTLTGSSFLTQLQTSGLLLFLSSTLSPNSLATFVTLRTLANSINQAASTVFAPAVPELVRLHIRRDYVSLRAGLLGLTAATTLFATLSAFALSVVGELFFTSWTRHKLPFDRAVFHLIVASVVWRILGLPLVNHLMAMNHMRWITLWSIAQSMSVLLLCIPGSLLWGAKGAAAALLIAEIIGSLVIPALWLRSQLPDQERQAWTADQLLCVATPSLATIILITTLTDTISTRIVVTSLGYVTALILFLTQSRRIPALRRQQLVQLAQSMLDRRFKWR